MREQEASVHFALSEVGLVEGQEVANVVGEQRPAERCRPRKHGSVVGTE